MDGSEISVVVLGCKGVGKSTFIDECQQAAEDSEGKKRIEICGSKVAVKFVEDPERQRLVHALATIVLFDITNEASFAELKNLLDMAQHIAPAAFPAVLGSKADLISQRKVEISDVLTFCKTRSCPVLYYEVSKYMDDSCVMALREILARPLINEHVLKATTDQELTSFVHKTMKWAIDCNSGNILTHLRGLGYTVPAELIQEHPAEMRDYFFGEYPLRLVPKFFHPPLLDLPAPSDDEDELCERDQPMSVVDVRPVLEVSSYYHMMWRDISLSCFIPSFLEPSAHYPVDQIVHINLSRNGLTSLPASLFQLQGLESLDVSHNEIAVLPPVEVWNHRGKLEVLIASHNLLRGSGGGERGQPSQAGATLPRGGQGVAVVMRSLWFVDLSYNNLSAFPGWVFHFPELSHLDLRYNEQITHLPSELCQLQKLDSLLLEGLPLLALPTTIAQQGLKTLKRYLHLKAQGSSPWHTLPVMVVGPEGSGKTTLLARLRGDDLTGIEPTIGLQLTELRHKSIILSRTKSCTLDLWDFSGSPKFCSVYSCFPLCHPCVHLLVFKQGTPTSEIARWLCEIHATSANVQVVILFTQMDRLRGSKGEEYRGEVERFLDVKASSGAQTNRSDDLGNFTVSVQTAPPILVTSLQEQGGREQPGSISGRERGSEWERDTFLHAALANVKQLFFVSGTTGENVASVKKYLCKLATRPKVSQSCVAPGLHLIGQEVPHTYFRIEQQIREIRVKYRAKKKGGEGVGLKAKPFWTFWEAKRLVQPLLNEFGISDSDFKCVLRFLHEASVVYTYECTDGSVIVASDPELVGQLLHRTVDPVNAKGENTPIRLMTCQDLCSLWGIATSTAPPQQDLEVSFQQLLEFLGSTDVCAPLHSGMYGVFPIVAPQFPLKQPPDQNMVSRRVYLFSYLPSLFIHHLMARLILSLNRSTSEACPLTSPPSSGLPSTDAVRLFDGSSLEVWANVLFLRNGDGSAVTVVSVAKGREVGLDALPCYGKVDVKVSASSLQEEACLLRFVTSVIDDLLKLKYPVIYEGPQTLEICVPILSDPLNCSSSSEDTTKPGGGGGGIPIAMPQKPPTPATSPNTNSLPVVGSYLSSTTNDGSWEVLSRRSSFAAKFALCQDASSTHSLVPVWECVQEAMRTPVTKFCGRRIAFQEVIPDLLYADLPKQCIYRATQSQSGNLCLPDMEDQEAVSPDVSGLRLKKYYTMAEDDVYMHRSADAQRTFCLKDFLAGTRNDFKKLLDLKCPYLVHPVGINFCPLVLALEAPPHGTLRSMIRSDSKSLANSFVHCISLQVLSVLQYLHDHGIHYHSLTSENIFIWSLDPASIKLGEAGIVHEPTDCMLCSYLNTIEDKTLRRSVGNQIDFIQLGCLEYEMATGKRPFEDVYSLDVLLIAILHNKLKINIEAHLTVQSQQLNNQPHITGCHRMCLQSIADECLHDPPRDPTSLTVLGARFSLCAGNCSWVPMRMLVNVECLVCSEDASLVYWSSGSRGLVTGVLEPKTGDLKTSLLQEAPTPESGLFAHKRGKPIPIAVGHTTALDMVYATQQLWVGTENGLMGSVYVFNLPDMRLHHHLHLQDAVLSLCALNGCGVHYGGDEMKYRVLLGLANGTIILFFGINQGKVVPNPLQGPKLQMFTTGRKPCLNMCPTSNGYIWCSCGDSLELLDIVSLKSLRKLDALVVAVGGSETPRGLRKGEVIMLMATNALGVWTVTRRSTLLRLWDAVTGAMKASYNVRNVLAGEDHDITALMAHGAALWLGTRTGYILLLDPSALVDGQNPLLGLQYCGKGKVKFIRPLVSPNKPTSKLEVVCSVEYEDEVSGVLLAWEFHPLQQWRAKEHHLNSGSLPTSPTSSLSPVHTNVQLSMSA